MHKSSDEKRDEYPFKDSLLALVLKAEIKRIATEKGMQVGDVISKLAKLSGISERQIYNYQMGKSDIPASQIPIFCKQFKSNALALALLSECDETKIEIPDSFDLLVITSRTARNTLKSHEEFIAAFEDGSVDGFELSRLKQLTAAGIRNMKLLQEIAVTSYEQQQARQSQSRGKRNVAVS